MTVHLAVNPVVSLAVSLVASPVVSLEVLVTAVPILSCTLLLLVVVVLAAEATSATVAPIPFSTLPVLVLVQVLASRFLLRAAVNSTGPLTLPV